MGKRRIRCLNSLGFHKIIGVDINIKRCDDSIKKYGIEAKQKLDVQDLFSVDAMIVSTPLIYIWSLLKLLSNITFLVLLRLV